VSSSLNNTNYNNDNNTNNNDNNNDNDTKITSRYPLCIALYLDISPSNHVLHSNISEIPKKLVIFDITRGALSYISIDIDVVDIASIISSNCNSEKIERMISSSPLSSLSSSSSSSSCFEYNLIPSSQGSDIGEYLHISNNNNNNNNNSNIFKDFSKRNDLNNNINKRKNDINDNEFIKTIKKLDSSKVTNINSNKEANKKKRTNSQSPSSLFNNINQNETSINNQCNSISSFSQSDNSNNFDNRLNKDTYTPVIKRHKNVKIYLSIYLYLTINHTNDLICYASTGY
jgi:hypothetical protein